MEQFRRYLFRATCCAVLLLPLAFMDVGQAVAAPAASNVNVVNTPNVNVGNTPTVNVANTPTVNVANTPTVTVDNPLLPVIEVTNPANQPFQEARTFSISSPNPSVNILFTQVPFGKRLVIEHVTVLIATTAGRMLVRLTTTVDGVMAAHHLVLTEQGIIGSQAYYLASQPIRLYADRNSVPFIIVWRSDATAITDGLVSISGHFVDVP